MANTFKLKIMKQILLFLSFLLLFGCSSEDKNETQAKYVIEFGDEPMLDIKDIVSDIQILELDTVEDALMKNLYDFQICNDRIYCLTTADGGQVKVFSLEGKYLFSINHRGHAKKEWVNACSMFVNPDCNRLCILDDASLKVLIYDLDGNFIDALHFGLYDTQEFVMDKNHFYSLRAPITSSYKISEDTDHLLWIYDNKGKFEKKCVKTKHIGYGMLAPETASLFLWEPERILFSGAEDEDVYSINDGEVTPYATYKYTGSKIEFYTNEELQKLSEKNEFPSSDKGYWNYVMESPQYLIRRIGCRDAYDVIYDKEHGKTYMTRFECDKLFVGHYSENNLYKFPYFYKDGRYYACLETGFFTLPEEFWKDYVPEQLKPYIDRIKNGPFNQLIISYKIDINK